MSAIWGCVDFSKKNIEPELCGSMQKALEVYKIDRFDGYTHKNAAMGCGLQFIRGNSEAEKLPVLDMEAGIFFTADCMIDNRAELTEALAPGEKGLTDGELLYLAYKKWGNSCNAHLCGAYSFAAYDFKNNTLIVSADHAASRSIYYCRKGSRLYFSTVIQCISGGLERPCAVNEDWLAEYLEAANYIFISRQHETPFDGVYKVLPGQYILFSEGGAETVEHWKPLELPRLELGDDNAFKEAFFSVMRKSVSEIVDTDVQIGMFLSGGMDSSSVAAFAAEALAGEGREIYSYTSVPVSGYEAKINKRVAQDETGGVQSVGRMYPNIKQNFCSLEGLNSLSGLSEILRFHEAPSKNINTRWLHSLAGQAREDGCRIMLTGQYGNNSISWGDVQTLASTRLYSGHPIRAVRTITRHCRRFSYSRKRLLKLWAATLVPRLSPRLREERKYTREESFIGEAFSKRTGSRKRMLKTQAKYWIYRAPPFPASQKARMDMELLSLCGEAETKLGLVRGVVLRDPTRDRRVCEFCLTAPLHCFVNDSYERRLVFDFMRELLPEELTKFEERYGQQSADWLYRLKLQWPEVLEELNEALNAPEISDFIDPAKVGAVLRSLDPERLDHSSLHVIFSVYTAALFLKQFWPAK